MIEKNKRIRFIVVSIGIIFTSCISLLLTSLIYSPDFSKLGFFVFLNIFYITTNFIVIWVFYNLLKKNYQMKKRTIFYAKIIIITMLSGGFLGFILMLIVDVSDYRFLVGLSLYEIQIFGFAYAGIINLLHEKD